MQSAAELQALYTVGNGNSNGFFHSAFVRYRDQNFGINELAAIQDVRNEYNLQDITDEPPSSSQTTNDRGECYDGYWLVLNLLFFINAEITISLPFKG